MKIVSEMGYNKFFTLRLARKELGFFGYLYAVRVRLFLRGEFYEGD